MAQLSHTHVRREVNLLTKCLQKELLNHSRKSLRTFANAPRLTYQPPRWSRQTTRPLRSAAPFLFLASRSPTQRIPAFHMIAFKLFLVCSYQGDYRRHKTIVNDVSFDGSTLRWKRHLNGRSCPKCFPTHHRVYLVPNDRYLSFLLWGVLSDEARKKLAKRIHESTPVRERFLNLIRGGENRYWSQEDVRRNPFVPPAVCTQDYLDNPDWTEAFSPNQETVRSEPPLEARKENVVQSAYKVALRSRSPPLQLTLPRLVAERDHS